jgi:hypothetical protein
MIQPNPGHYVPNKELETVKKYALDLSLNLFDLRPNLEALFYDSSHEYETLFFPGAHMTGQGNLFVAKNLAPKIKEI